MVAVEQNGYYITLQDNEHVFSDEVIVVIFQGKKRVIPKTVDAVAVIESDHKYYIAQYVGKWYVKNINPNDSLGLALPISMKYMKPSRLCSGILCSQISVFIDELNYVVYPNDPSLPSLVQAEGDKERLVYAFIPEIGWISV